MRELHLAKKLRHVSDQYSGFSLDWQIQFLRHWPLMTDAGSSELCRSIISLRQCGTPCKFRNRTRGQQSLDVVQRSGLVQALDFHAVETLITNLKPCTEGFRYA
jgi:hypothetical protein